MASGMESCVAKSWLWDRGESLLFFFLGKFSPASPSQPGPACSSHGALNSISWCCACHARSRIVVVFFFLLICVRACVRAVHTTGVAEQPDRGRKKNYHIGGPADALCLVPACRKGRAVEGTACAIMHDTYCCCCCAWLS